MNFDWQVIFSAEENLYYVHKLVYMNLPLDSGKVFETESEAKIFADKLNKIEKGIR